MPSNPQSATRWNLPQSFGDLSVVPIAFLDEDGDVIASGVSGEDIQVPYGTYYLSLKLPNGRTVIGNTQAQIGEVNALPTLEAELGRHLDIERFRGSVETTAESFPPIDAALGETGFAALHLRGHLFSSLGQGMSIAQPLNWALPPTLSSGRHSLIRISHDDQVVVLPADHGYRMVVLPFDQMADEGGGPLENITIDLDLENRRVRFLSAICSGTNVLADYVEHGLLNDSTSLATAVLQRAPLPEEDDASLMGVLLSAYVQLRNSSLDLLEASLAHIAHTAETVPDYWAIAAELFARQGRHDEAISALSRCVDHRCPWFRSGLGYSLQRLSLYLEADADEVEFALSSPMRGRLSGHLTTLRALASRLDTRELMTTFLLERAELDKILASRPGSSMREGITAGLQALQNPSKDAWDDIHDDVFS